MALGGKKEPLFAQTIRTSLHTASGVFQLFCTAEEQLLRSWRLQFQIQVRAHKRLPAIQSCCLTSRLTINLDSLTMLPTLLLKFCRPQEGICKYYMFRHVDKHLLQEGSEICDNGIIELTPDMLTITSKALERKILHLLWRTCIIKACFLC